MSILQCAKMKILDYMQIKLPFIYQSRRKREYYANRFLAKITINSPITDYRIRKPDSVHYYTRIKTAVDKLKIYASEPAHHIDKHQTNSQTY